MKLSVFLVFFLTLFNFQIVVADEVTVGDGPTGLELYRYRGHEVYPQAGLIYYFDQLDQPRTYRWSTDVTAIESRFPVISVAANGKPCHFHSDAGCQRLRIPEGSVLYETFTYIGSDIQGTHFYRGILQVRAPDGNIIRHRRTQCNSLPSTTANVGCPFEVPDVRIETHEAGV